MTVLCCLELQRSYANMFDKEEIFNGDLSRERQKDSVPSPLLHLSSLIHNKYSTLDKYNANSKTIAVKRIVCLRNIEKRIIYSGHD